MIVLQQVLSANITATTTQNQAVSFKLLQQQAKRPTQSQPGRSSKQKHNNPDCNSATGQHLLEKENN